MEYQPLFIPEELEFLNYDQMDEPYSFDDQFSYDRVTSYGRPGYGYGRPGYGRPGRRPYHGRPGYGYGRRPFYPGYGYGRPGYGYGRPPYGYYPPYRYGLGPIGLLAGGLIEGVL